jgi:aspartyl-tRNA(Asn)/glutamyl-tRNA(Gln) amidotransferase subunit A
MNDGELCFAPVTQLTAMMRRRQLSPVELTDIVLKRQQALQPKLNAFVTVLADQARAEAKSAEAAIMRGDALGPMHGLPIGIKDFIDVKGVRTTFSSYLFENNVAGDDAVVVKRVRAAGAIIIGKTGGSDNGWKATGDSPLTGTIRNPWSLEHTPGGSSSGAAASVAAGIGPMAIGTDGAGSIRIPASFSGIFGMKPSYGRVPQPGQSPLQGSHTGPMSRTVADSALLLKVIAGRHDSDPSTLQGPPDDYPLFLQRGIAGKRMAWSPDLGFARRVHPEVAAACANAARAFEECGAIVEETSPDWGDPMPFMLDFWPAVWAGRIGDRLAEFRDRLDPRLVLCAEEGLRQPPATLFRAMVKRVAFCERIYRFFERYDFLLTPSVAVPALRLGLIAPEDFPEHPWDWLCWSPFSFIFNLSWNPAATVPAGFTGDGRPIGLQIVGRHFDDLGVLQAASAFEQLRPWSHLRPVLT